MRVALVTDYFITGGGLEHIRQIVKYLPHINFAVFAKKGEAIEKFSSYQNVQIFSEGYSPFYINRFRPDIVHFHHLKPLALYYTFPLKTRTIPGLFTLHGAHIHKYEFLPSLKSKLGYRLRYHFEKYLFHRVDQIITVSQDDLKFTQNLYKIENLKCISHGLDLDKFKGIKTLSRIQIRKEYNLPPDAFVFLTIARFDFAKGYDVLTKAIQLSKNQLSTVQVRFVFAGDGEEYNRISDLVKKQDLERFILFIKKFDDIKKLMVSSDALILPSRWEGFPLVLMEVGYCQLPVIASNTYGIREIIEHQQTGLLFANENSKQLATLIQDILKHRYNLKNLSENLYQKVIREYDLSKSIGRLEQIYHEMCRG